MLFILFLTCVAARKVLKDKIRARDKTYSIEPGTDLLMCKAVVMEMHTEVIKHKIKDGGEDGIWETAGMAICLGVVQNYTFQQRPSGKWGMIFNPKNDDDDSSMFGAATTPEEQAKVVQGLLLTKEACMQFAEEMQQAISEVIYARVDSDSASAIADDFCPQAVAPEKQRPKTRSAAPPPGPSPPPPKQQEDMYAKFQDFIRERDTSGAIEEILTQEANHPEKMLPPALQEDIKEAREAAACRVCQIAMDEAARQTAALRTRPAFKDRWQRESLITSMVARLCHGADYDRVQEGYYPQRPGNPPEWVDAWDLKDKGAGADGGRWRVVRRRAGAKGREKEMGREEGERRQAHVAALTQACRLAVDERLSDSDGDLAGLIKDRLDWPGKRLAEEFCGPVCRADDGGGGDKRGGKSGKGEGGRKRKRREGGGGGGGGRGPGGDEL